ncbi:MAG TPA: outer membrane beta-barrel protein [Bacteroidales bacterium]|nr:outer membrane beta-barrel protein [Bacteroidales bacterium]
MSEPGANIDLLFRNGLKDFEVLPPPEVWDSICSSGKIKRHPIVFFRVAAVAAVLMSVGFLTFRLSRETATVPDSTLAFNIEKSYPVIHNEILRKEAITTKQITNISASAASERTEYMHPISIEKQTVSTESIVPLNSRSNLTLTNSESSLQSFLNPQNSSGSKTLYVRYTDLQYMPADKLVDRWSIAAMASPTYYSQFNSGSDAFSKELMKSEQPLVSYSGGVAFSYKISKRFSIQSGLYYSSLGQKLEGINSFAGFKQFDNTKGGNNFEVPTTTGTVQASNPDVFLNSDASNRVVTPFTSNVFDPNKASLQYINSSLTQSLSYLELPVFLRYKILDKTIGINLIGGLSYNLLVHNSVYTEVDGGKYLIGDTKGLNPLTLSSSLGMGMEYNFSEKLSINLEPTFRYYMNPFSVSTGSFIHPYSFGIFSGVSYKF